MNKSVTRRAALAGIDPIPALETALLETYAAEARLGETATDEDVDAFGARISDLQDEIIATPASSLAGIAAKLRTVRLVAAMVEFPTDQQPVADEDFEFYYGFVFSALRDVERLAGQPVGAA